jgi:hypothetical protein
LFDSVRLSEVKVASRRKLRLLDHMDDLGPNDDPYEVVEKLNDTYFLDRANDSEKARKAGSYYSPLASEVEPSRSRFTLQKLATLTKQAFLSEADRLRDIEDMFDAWHRVSKMTVDTVDQTGDVTMVSRVVDAFGGRIGQLSAHELNQAIKAMGLQKHADVASLRRLNRIAQQNGLTVSDGFDVALKAFFQEQASSPRWAKDFGMDVLLRTKDGQVVEGLDALKLRRQALLEEANYRAAEADLDGLIKELTDAGRLDEAAELKNLAAAANDQGYRVVYGADFLAPDEVLHQTGQFADLNRRHMNAMTLGNFFARQHPVELAAKIQRFRTAAVVRELAKARGVDAIDAEGPEAAQIMQDLYQFVLDPQLQINAQLSDELAHMSWLSKRATAARNADLPRSLQDLGLGKNRSIVVETLMKLGYSDRDAGAIWQGLKAGRYADWHDQGLYAIEAKLRQNNQALGALRVFSGTKEGERLTGGAALKRAVTSGGAKGAFVGAGLGAVRAEATTPEGEDPSLARTLEFAAAGAAGGLLGGTIGGAAAGRVAAKMDYTNMARYGYLADNLAALRDKMRFTLSPFFDMSRYTEALVLNQIAGPMRDASGKRIGLPFNTSPRKLKATIGETQFAARVAEMRAASGGIYDLDNIEATNRWFKEIGILGFSPTDWMASTFHHLREKGLDAGRAWDEAQKMYHYGAQGRSAAELSVNFIFFPFSFQKKTLTHAAQFLADDMMRSVLLHDMYAGYQVLDEKYDLGAFAEEHLPVLEQLNRLNMFAYGISPGTFGGINAPFVNAVVGADPMGSDPSRKGLLFNLFGGVAVSIGPEDDKGRVTLDTLQKLAKKMVPAVNDIHYMLDSVKEQGHVMFSPSHVTTATEAGRGFDTWSEYKSGVEARLKSAGASLYDMYNNPGLAPLLAEYQQKKVELSRLYPAWVQAKQGSIQRQAELELEKEGRIANVQLLGDRASLSDQFVDEMESRIARIKEVLGQRGITAVEDWPPDMMARVRGVAIDMAANNPGIERLWGKFYAREFGPITSAVI